MILTLFQNQDNCPELSNIVPITGMDEMMTTVILGVLLPLILSIFIAIIFARFVTPLYLKIKNKILARDYKDGYILQSTSPLSKGVVLKRMIYLILLTFGFLSFFLPLADPNQWLSPETICSYGEHHVNPYFHFGMLITINGLIYPLAIGLWAVSWALEDAGLMHYAFLDEDNYEIEPVNIWYTSYLKGYAGISALMFIVRFTYEIFVQNSAGDAALIFAVLLISIISFFPTYIIFTKTMGSHGYLRKGLDELKKLTEKDIKK